ncbi:hypothetical protein F0L74_23530 [Chitinophaga agrisoli]|uniref:Dolichyl-phosphate-mannose-protein mannosyltransferase n=1 Tax=Chitinophaga agrisoli TaxID=2607653 RepID=A0A5B2VJF0_9BACT|nr:glycosyltransferase family 39 protein [Chitinophaga agrisoli]KAA2239181.1 hypothetical protein F0L74_23530 [Chitinophaga agrisoli]
MRSSVLSGIRQLLLNGVLIPVVYLIGLGIIAVQHQLFVDWDGPMHYFSAVEIYSGKGYHGWQSHFWPPLYPLLGGLLARVMDGAAALKMVSVISAALLLYVVHRFVRWLSGSSAAGCLAQCLVAVIYVFVHISIQAEDHMLDSLFFISALFLLLKNLDGLPPLNLNRRYLLLGMLCALAGLTRYTSYALIPATVITLCLYYPFKTAVRYGLLVLLGFAVLSAPWWIVNTIHNGSPFATWQYMNIGAGIFAADNFKWWWSGIDHFNSTGDVFRHAPGLYLRNFFRNLVYGPALILYKGGAVTIVCLVACGLFMFYYGSRNRWLVLRSRKVLPLLITFVVFLLLVSQAFVFAEVFLSWMVLAILYGAWSFYELIGAGSHAKENPIRPRSNFIKKALTILIAVALCWDLGYTVRHTRLYLNDPAGLEENQAVTAAIKQQDDKLQTKTLMAYHPGRAYHLGTGFIMLPMYYSGDVSGIITFKGLSNKIKGYAPRFPTAPHIDSIKADYLVYDSPARKWLPQFAFLLQRNSPLTPPNFHLVYLSGKTAVYRID